MLIAPPLALYIHLPWCERKCPYCDFNSHTVSEEAPFVAYVQRLLQDLELELDGVAGRELQSIFIGGGTPSLCPDPLIATLLDGVRARMVLATDAEITLEANPGSADAGRFAGYRAAGVNRLSIGVQSFDDTSLAALGRVHDARGAHAAITAARAAGFDALNLDLMHGLPGQTDAMAMADLAAALAHTPEHLSWYQLTLEPNTVFHRHPPRLPGEDTLAEIQEHGERLLTAAGYTRYEVSAWAHPGFRCRHNLNYWHFGDYLGIGAGAHGKLSLGRPARVVRTRRTRSPADYLAGSVQANRIQETVEPSQLVLEFLMNALRLPDGTTVTEFEART
ncbi:MAG TPA: radical SAM family heme chaperone HemW, partial [Pseudomonadales bacterium]|nr:radical SAM family heme chaperone HemW [Pseudomonadales bacterium]